MAASLLQATPGQSSLLNLPLDEKPSIASQPPNHSLIVQIFPTSTLEPPSVLITLNLVVPNPREFGMQLSTEKSTGSPGPETEAPTSTNNARLSRRETAPAIDSCFGPNEKGRKRDRLRKKRKLLRQKFLMHAELSKWKHVNIKELEGEARGFRFAVEKRRLKEVCVRVKRYWKGCLKSMLSPYKLTGRGQDFYFDQILLKSI